ncbi:MAG: TspO/MBR family protein [Acidimicrobiia bacterium]
MQTTTETSLPISNGRQVVGFLAFALGTAVVAGLGSLATSSSVDSAWFADLDKPAFYPPGALFGIVWTVLYALVAVAGWLAWRRGGGSRVVIPWAVQIVLNVGWSLVFFGLRQPGWAMVVIVTLLAAIVWTIVAMWPHDHTAAYLMIPYLSWVVFATVLNGAIVALN